MRDEAVEVSHEAAQPEPKLSFEDWYERERVTLAVLVHALCRSTQPSVAEDIVQDAFVRAYERWPTIGEYDRPDLWLRRVAINLATSRFRRLKTELGHASRRRSAEYDELVLSDDAASLLDALRRLPPRQAQVLALRYIDELSTADIGRVLGMADGTVRTHLRRGHDALRHDPRFEVAMKERLA